MGSGEWGVGSGEWQEESGEWRVESGKRRVESGKRREDLLSILSLCRKLKITTFNYTTIKLLLKYLKFLFVPNRVIVS